MSKVIDFSKRCGVEALRLDCLSGDISVSELAHRFGCTKEEALDRIGIIDLNQTFAYSSEEIDAMIRKNETFKGKHVSFDKITLFNEIKEGLDSFLQCCGAAQKIEEIKPNQYDRNAVLVLDIDLVSILDKAEVSMLTAIMKKADRVVFSAAGEDCIRISFGIEDIWTDGVEEGSI